jgi:hypothetical protein
LQENVLKFIADEIKSGSAQDEQDYSVELFMTAWTQKVANLIIKETPEQQRKFIHFYGLVELTDPTVAPDILLWFLRHYLTGRSFSRGPLGITQAIDQTPIGDCVKDRRQIRTNPRYSIQDWLR